MYQPRIINKCRNILEPMYQLETDSKAESKPEKLELPALVKNMKLQAFDDLENSEVYSREALEEARKHVTAISKRKSSIIVDKTTERGYNIYNQILN
jgi:hypothetical protein